MDLWQSQIAQDRFVDVQMAQKDNGSFLDIGCGDYKDINNTYALEKGRNWYGIGIDNEQSHEEGWLKFRRNSMFLCADARKVDYSRLIEVHYASDVIDYLSIDIEPPVLALDVLELVIETGFIFNCVTFEHDWYRQQKTLRPSRELMLANDYILVMQTVQDDFYIHKTLRAKSERDNGEN